MTQENGKQKAQSILLYALLIVVFGGLGFLVRWLDFTVPIIRSNVGLDPREIFVIMGALITGPAGGFIIGAISGLALLPDPLTAASVIAHAASGFCIGLGYRYLYQHLRLPVLVAAFALAVIGYYYLVLIPVFISSAGLLYPDGLTLLFGPDIPFWQGYSILAEAVIPEALLTLVLVILIYIALPPRYRKPLGSVKRQQPISMAIPGVSKLAIRLGLWFIILSSLPMLILLVFLQQNVQSALTEYAAHQQYDVASVLAAELELVSNPETITHMLSATASNGMTAFLLADNGTYAAHPDAERLHMPSVRDYRAVVMQTIIEEGDGTYTSPITPYLFAFTPVGNLDATVVVVNERQTFPLVTLVFEQQSTLILFVGIFIISIGGAVAIWLVVGLPVRKLTQAAHRISAGELDTRVETDEMFDDLEVLAATFNQMTNELVRTIETLNTNTERLNALRNIDRAILAAESPQAIIHGVLTHIQHIVSCNFVIVEVMHPAGKTYTSYRLEANQQLEILVNPAYEVDEHWFAHVRNGQMHVIDNLALQEHTSVEMKTLVARGIRSLAVVPLHVRDELIGVLHLLSEQASYFEPEHHQVAREIADQLAVAIQQAQLYQQVQQQAQELEVRVEERTAELLEANEQLKALTVVKDEFVSNVSHELRTPITSMKLYHSLMKLNTEKSESYHVRLGREIERLSQLIEDMLRLSRLDQARVDVFKQPVDLNTLAAQFVDDRLLIARQNQHQLEFIAHPDQPSVPADVGLLGQVLSILLTNAFNYTPVAGQITVSVTMRYLGAKNYAGICVQDTGPGIPDDEKHRLFERFFRGKVARQGHPPIPGTGLGLSIAKEIVDLHDGQIEVEDNDEAANGTRFTVWLPAVTA